MKYALYIVFILIPILSTGQQINSVIGFTKYFEVHSNYWINLHHFLYQQAKGSQLEHLQEDGNDFLDIGEQEVLANLNEDEKEILDKAVEYYRINLADRSLFRMGDLRVWLQKKDAGAVITTTTFSEQFTTVLNSVSHVYKSKIWPVHDEHNNQVLKNHEDMIKNVESRIFKKLEDLTGDQMPDSRIRLDLTVYANFAGAYTVTRPVFNIFISTKDPSSKSYSFIETVFHEGAHLLFTRESPFRAKIFHTSEELGMEFPNNLWHASQFYLVGRLIQDFLLEKGIEYEMNMDTRHIFTNYNTPGFRSILEDYYKGESGIDGTIRKLLMNLK